MRTSLREDLGVQATNSTVEVLPVAEHASVIRVTRFQPAPGKREELVRRLEEGAEQMRQMDGCFGSQICASDQSSEAIVAVSRWASRAALDQFVQQSATQRNDVAQQLASGPPTSEHLTPI
jgi:quinol monooxygenase YgiN